VTRLIQLLRAHGLVAKIPHTRRYRVTAQGELLMIAAIKVKEIAMPMAIREAV
jgi:DNA-binding IclR family transcriptional regulator